LVEFVVFVLGFVLFVVEFVVGLVWLVVEFVVGLVVFVVVLAVSFILDISIMSSRTDLFLILGILSLLLCFDEFIFVS
jgi:hypothetical protein